MSSASVNQVVRMARGTELDQLIRQKLGGLGYEI